MAVFDVVQVGKVYDRGATFAGCLFNVVYNGAALSLWQSVLRTDSRAACCSKPPSAAAAFPVAVAPTLPAVAFFGFGYVSYVDPSPATPPQSRGSLGLKLKFRTFAPDAVVVLLLTGVDADVADYCGIFLDGGKLQWYISSADGDFARVESQRTYNTGRWYEVSAASFSSVDEQVSAVAN